jgi:cytochrome oxidase Cu insertion factor (SCO1/SenC/PrrC family)
MSPRENEENARANMPRISIALVVAFIAVLLVAVPRRGASGSEAKRRGDNGAARKGEKVDYLPGASLIDQNGKPVSLTWVWPSD